MTNPFLYWLLTVISAGAAAYLGSYLKQKGQNLATHEDVQKLVAQMEATTAATKAIEGRISDEFWNKQRVWEMKRDTILGLLANIRLLSDTLSKLNVIAVSAKRLPEGSVEHTTVIRKRTKALRRWGTAWSALIARRSEAAILCSPEVFHATNNLSVKLFESYQLAKDGKVEDFAKLGGALRDAERPLHVAIHQELGIAPFD